MGYILKGRDEDGTEYLMHYGIKGMKWENHLNSVLSEPQQADKKGYKKIVSSVGNGNTIDNIKNTYKNNKTKRAINKAVKAQTNAIKSTVKGYVSNAENKLNTAAKSAKKSVKDTATKANNKAIVKLEKYGYGSERKTGQSWEQRGKSALNVSKQKVNNVKKEIDSRNKNDKVSSTIKSLIKNKKKK